MADTPTAPPPRPARPQRPEVRRFTAAELAQFDGVDGRSAYVGYKGFVWDVTASLLWRKGKHVNQHVAGVDLTAEMAGAPHADDVMARFPIVGVLVADDAPEAAAALVVREAPPFVDFFLQRHFHPVTVHYPMAFSVLASLLTVLALPLQSLPVSARFESISWWLILFSALFTAPASVTGLWSWWYQHGGALTGNYLAKVRLTFVLLGLTAATILLHWLAPAETRGSWAYWVYSLLVIAHAPVVLSLGWYGGKITFPDMK
jgi:predicted heme/steroid binding protein/uncharacterized membrane protein